MNIAVETTMFSCPQAETKVISVMEAAVMDFPLPVGSYNIPDSLTGPLDLESIDTYSLWTFASMMSTNSDVGISGLEAAILDFALPIRS